MQRPRPLTPEQAKFVEYYCQGGMKLRDAAIRAGYEKASAHTRAYKLVHENPAVMEAIKAYNDTMKATLDASAKYTITSAQAECDAAIDFAIAQKSPAAYVKAVELKARLNGLLQADKGAEAQGFQINILGLAVPGGQKFKPVEEVPAPAAPLPVLDIFAE